MTPHSRRSGIAIGEQALLRGASSRHGHRDLALAGHVPDQFRKPGWSDDHCRDVQFHQLHHRRAVIPSEACIAATSQPAVRRPVSPRQVKTFAQTLRSTTSRGTHTRCGAHARPIGRVPISPGERSSAGFAC